MVGNSKRRIGDLVVSSAGDSLNKSLNLSF